jgi:hypothetical protein
MSHLPMIRQRAERRSSFLCQAALAVRHAPGSSAFADDQF